MTGENHISIEQMDGWIHQNQDALVLSFIQSFTQLQQKIAQLDTETKSVHIIYLRTSVNIGQPYFRLYSFNEKQYNGNIDCWVSWEMPELMKQIENIVTDKFRTSLPSPKIEFQKEQKRLQYADILYRELDKVIQELVNQTELELNIDSSIPIYFGEYMSEQKKIFPLMEQGEKNGND